MVIMGILLIMPVLHAIVLVKYAQEDQLKNVRDVTLNFIYNLMVQHVNKIAMMDIIKMMNSINV